MRYQDDLFNINAIPPEILVTLGKENRDKSGVVEAYIYRHFQKKQLQMMNALEYVDEPRISDFDLKNFLNLFWKEPGLRRSMDKIYEIVVYSLFHVLIRSLEANISISVSDDKKSLLNEFQDFTTSILGITASQMSTNLPAALYRVGVTNASDRGLDMWGNFGPAVQIKHVSLTEERADDIVSAVSADKVIIVCKDVDKDIIDRIFEQIGGSRIHGIVCESDLIDWYKKAFKGLHKDTLAPKIIETMKNEIVTEFPASDQSDFLLFFNERNYHKIKDFEWEGGRF